jgi:hypothetical protein
MGPLEDEGERRAGGGLGRVGAGRMEAGGQRVVGVGRCAGRRTGDGTAGGGEEHERDAGDVVAMLVHQVQDGVLDLGTGLGHRRGQQRDSKGHTASSSMA